MFKNLGNISGLMKTIGQLPERMRKLKAEMEARRINGQACEGDHRVSVVVNGLGLVQTVDISDSLLHPEHKTIAQRLTLDAMNEAIGQAKELHVQAIRELSHGVELPGLNSILEEMAK